VAFALSVTNDDRAKETLNAALKNKELDIVAGAYRDFISKGESGTECILIESLNKYGTSYMANDFAHCGNTQLQEAARKWAKSQGEENELSTAHAYAPRWGEGQTKTLEEQPKEGKQKEDEK
jgi:hypothetical protein